MIEEEDIHDGGITIPDGKICNRGAVESKRLGRSGAKLLTSGFHLDSEVYHEQG
jgi:hypothetical protein